MPARRHVSELPKVPPMRVPWGSADLSYWRSAHPATVHGLRVRGVVYYISWCASRERLEGNFKAYWGQVWDIWGPFWVSWGLVGAPCGRIGASRNLTSRVVAEAVPS